ncbi:MAG: transmembrane 220 family protein [Candidatus Neomarinimicrobiota bacterium]|nr:transmembrane 220 family protein [Candidatus Neomarinimicrobiota bacterium]
MKKNHIHKLISIIFIFFGLLNINDPDWFIWLPLYFIIALLPFTLIDSKKILFACSAIVLGLGLLTVFGYLDRFMPIQHDAKMVNMIENQREGLGLILGALWLAFTNKFNNEKI